MKTKVIIFLIYFSGVIFGYLDGKQHLIKGNKKSQSKYPNIDVGTYTVRDKMFVLAMSTTSWADVIAIELIELKDKIDLYIDKIDLNREAEW